MNDIVQFVLKHGYPILFAALFAHQLGLPVPGPLFLLAAGALAAAGKLSLLTVLGLAIIASILVTGHGTRRVAGAATRYCTSFTALREILTPMIAGRKRLLPVMALRFSSSQSSSLDWMR